MAPLGKNKKYRTIKNLDKNKYGKNKKQSVFRW